MAWVRGEKRGKYVRWLANICWELHLVGHCPDCGRLPVKKDRYFDGETLYSCDCGWGK
jgi:hypothetical protein